MTIRENLSFTYAGVTSNAMGVMNVSINSGLYEESFFSSRNIIEEKTPYRDIPYFYGIERAVKEFTMTLHIDNGWDNEKFREIQFWLAQTTYQPLQFDDDNERIYYCMPVGDITISHNGTKQGYIVLNMKCDSPFAYSPFYVTENYDLTINTNGYNLTLPNYGDFICKPQVFIEKIGNGDISIINTSMEGKEFKFTGLADKENIFVDNEYEEIETDIVGLYRYDNFNNQYLELSTGNNYLRILGNCRIYFRYRYKLL